MTQLTRLPASDLRRVQREIDTVFNEFFGAPRAGRAAAAWAPRVDIHEDEQAYTLLVDVPGVAKEALRIDFHEGVLTVAGEREAAARAEGTSVVRAERHAGAFHRAFSLPQAVDADAIEASVADGVLAVRAPKAEVARPRRISVN